jgi:hypothetical protein
MTVLRSLSDSRTCVFQSVLHRTCSLSAAFGQPVLGLSEKNLRPLFSLLRLLGLTVQAGAGGRVGPPGPKRESGANLCAPGGAGESNR